MNTDDLESTVMAMPGWCNEEKARILYGLIISEAPELSVELGVFGGRSLMAIALGHKEVGSGMVLGVDAWRQSASLEGINDKANDEWWSALDYNEIYYECVNALSQQGLDDIILLCRSKSMMLSKFIADDSIGLIHQDSNHSEEVTCDEVNAFWTKLKSGGIWVSDDTNWVTVKKSVDLLKSFGAITLQVVDNSDKTQQFTVFKKP